MSGNDLAKELIRRRVHPPPPPRRPPRLRPASPVGNATTTSSYEMVEQPQENQHSPTLADNEEHRRFWRLRRRPQSHAPLGLGKEEQDGGIERRVVSEPTEQRRGVFNRLRLRRASEAGQQEDRNVTFVSETEDSVDPDGSETSTHAGTLSPNLSTPGNKRGHIAADIGPSFISLSPASATSTSTFTSTAARHPKLGSISAAGSRRTLAPALITPARSIGRGAAIRAISLEARLADTSLESTSTDQSAEYPSQVDTSCSDGPRGILRARNTRVPPNTPTPIVRFADTWLTGIKTPVSQKKDLELERADILPPAQLSGGTRWKRLGAILGAVSVERITTSQSAVHDWPSPTTPVRHTKSSDSPISFARFDRDEHITTSTPLRRTQHPVGSTLPTPETSTSESDTASSTPSLVPARPVHWSRRFSDEEAVFEPCSAIEALWEYGSSDGGDSEVDAEASCTTGRLGGPFSSTQTAPMTVSYDVDPLSPDPDPIVTPLDNTHIVIDTGTSGSAPPVRPSLQDRRDSGGLIPLKYRGGSFDAAAAAAESDPFPFATALKF